MNTSSLWSDDESSEEEILISSKLIMHYDKFRSFLKQTERESRARSPEYATTQREDAPRHHHVVGICDGPSEAFNCCLYITSMVTLEKVGKLLATLERNDTLEWNWKWAQYTFHLQRLPDIIACLQKKVYLSKDDILPYSIQLKEANEEEIDARKSWDKDAENEAARNSNREDCDDDLEKDDSEDDGISGSFDCRPLELDDSDEEDIIVLTRPISSSSNAADTRISSSKVLPVLILGKKRKGKCSKVECIKQARISGGKCHQHGGGKRCSEKDCNSLSHKGGKCRKHGEGKKKCSEINCENVSQQAGKCHAHGPACSTQYCDSAVRKNGKCTRHYEAELCHIHGAPATRNKDGTCTRRSEKRKTTK